MPADTSKLPPPRPITKENELPDLMAESISHAEEKRRWYLIHGRRNAAASFGLRILGLIALAGAALWSIVHTMPAQNSKFIVGVDVWGLLALGVGSGAFVVDKMFGVSAGWVRRMTAAMAIEGQMKLFRLRFSRAVVEAGPDERVVAGLSAAEEFITTVNGIVLDETSSWGTEARRLFTEFGRLVARHGD
jgi:hypothetical protein